MERPPVAPVSRRESGHWHLAVAWASCKADRRIHQDQWRAVKSVEFAFGLSLSPDDVLEWTAHEVVQNVTLRRHRWSEMERLLLFATACWVTYCDHQTHGLEAWFLCRLRRALDLSPRASRRVFGMARHVREQELNPPTSSELSALFARVVGSLNEVNTGGSGGHLPQP
jgi:hypothetical protein